MTRRDRIAAIAAAVVLVVAPFAIGSALRWGVCLTSALAIASAVPLLRSRRVLPERSPLLLFLGLAAAATAIQVIPWPAALVELLAPARWALAADNAAALGHAPPGFVALSYDPASTLVELAKLAGYFAFAYTALRLAASTAGRRWLATTVAFTAAAVAVTALGHYAAGAESLFGIYEPRFAPPEMLAPLLNENHLAGYLALATPVALALAVTSSGATRIACIGAVAVSAGAALLTASRGGAIALVAGLAVFLVLFRLQRRRGARERASPIPLSVGIPAGIVVLCGIVLLGALTAGGVLDELGATSSDELHDEASKYQVWRRSTGLLDANRWTGVGRGAFEHAFTRIDVVDDKIYSHVENEYLQIVVDWGIPVALALGFVLVLVGLTALQRWRVGPLEAGALAGLTALALQSTVDFALELPGVAIPALAVLAVLLPSRPTTRTSDRRFRPVHVRAAASAAGAVLVLLAASPLGRGPRATAEAMAAAPDGDPVDAMAAFERHPSSYRVAGQLAQRLFADRDPRAVAVVNRALYLNPTHSGLHHLAARMLYSSRSPEQALVEYALAAATARDSTPVLADLIRRFPKARDAAGGLPLDPERARRLVAILRRLERPDVGLQYAVRMAEAFPANPDLLQLAAETALAGKQADTAAEYAVRAHAGRPDTRSAVLAGRALRAAGKLEQGLALVDAAVARARGLGRPAELVPLLGIRADILYASGDYPEAKDSMQMAVELAAGDRNALIAAHRRLGSIEAKLGNTHRSEWHRRRADELAAD